MKKNKFGSISMKKRMAIFAEDKIVKFAEKSVNKSCVLHLYEPEIPKQLLGKNN
ncbi:hypothetical protein PWEIH_12460 [Listeria weihenstephanensis FSL R9-0317]|uniref:cyclic lactone autoinducer peptide n=1 Tax=Listeria weihenstephanensis TaxID=1006155 RepID=UPI0003E8AB0D|nr:cyclic lactone autoinducer peptide [Listeria weihenstephanensis]EUJ36606.1 hypothetical protein PWEIH_12460 [Listeria weihenstephanensis FSL R9-0317]